MTFLADEGVDRQIVERLRIEGHQVSYIAEMSPGITDETVLMQSRVSESILITADKDFGELVSDGGKHRLAFCSSDYGAWDQQ